MEALGGASLLINPSRLNLLPERFYSVREWVGLPRIPVFNE